MIAFHFFFFLFLFLFLHVKFADHPLVLVGKKNLEVRPIAINKVSLGSGGMMV